MIHQLLPFMEFLDTKRNLMFLLIPLQPGGQFLSENFFIITHHNMEHDRSLVPFIAYYLYIPVDSAGKPVLYEVI